MAKLTLSDLTSTTTNGVSAATTINNNNAAIETALENTLSRDGTTPNTMSADLDMNTNKILNLASATQAGEAVEYTQLQDLEDAVQINADLVAAAVSLAEGYKTAAKGYSEDAEDHADDAADTLTLVQALYTAFKNFYLGSFATNPTVDIDGNALTAGDIYFNTTTNESRVWTGTEWINIAAVTALSTDTFKNKSIDLADNTLTGTLAEFNTALSDDNFASLTGSETLTNKSIDLTNNTLTGTFNQFTTALSDADFLYRTSDVTVNKIPKFFSAGGRLDDSQMSEDSSGNVSVTGDLTVGDDILLGNGAVINFDSGDATITHSANLLTLGGATLLVNSNIIGNNFIPVNGGGFIAPTNAGNTANIGAWDVDGATTKAFITLTSGNTPTATMSDITVSSDLNPTTDDGASLGTTTNKWSDLHLASGGVVNFDDGNFTITHSNNALTLAADSGFGSINYTGNLRSSNFIPNAGGAFLANTQAGNVANISAWDVDGATPKAFITLTSNNTPTCTIQDVTINSSTIGSDCTATTQSASDDSTKLATTAFVKDAAEPLGLSTVNTRTASYTLALADQGKLIRMNVASSNNLTIPTNTSVAFPVGTRIDAAQVGAGATSVKGDTGVTLNGVSAGTGTISQQYGAVCLIKVATNTWEVYGAIGTVA